MWFTHDNHPDLLKELVWEAGNPCWVLHGTPASGAGVLGCLEMGGQCHYPVRGCSPPQALHHTHLVIGGIDTQHSGEALGAGVLGCLETGVSVITLCEDAHHRKHFTIPT